MTAGPRERLVMSAIELVRRKGVAGTGLTELLEHSGAARRSIYQHFPHGKAELIEVSTRTAGEFMTARLAALVDGRPTADAMRAFVEQWKGVIAGSGYESGCPVVGAALGRSEAPGAADEAGTAIADWERVLTASLRRDGADDAIAESLATLAISSIEGAVMLSLAGQSTDPLDRVSGHLVELIERHTGT
ncbi:TetR/AcrR family transcriptional regulator [Tomitella biformata]|uniref:TetR/AcrR family transcriptional regulator n=1 Tax=Tomitella biformata TaxID=630403 RepID=UPI0004647D0B|nr:TetR/AcrR family transcriptional regulator [Tomitella biformata]